MTATSQRPKILIVGGGAGGLELATILGQKLGKTKQADITLIDPHRVHLWKPLLHEVVAGSLDTGAEALSYRAHSAENHYYFRMGAMQGIDLESKQIIVAPLLDHHGKQILAERRVDYDMLVMALGAHSNDFGIAGVKTHCFTLDSAQEAEDFHLSFLNRFLQFSEVAKPEDSVHIAIVGAGATGVELSAELYNAVDRLEQFGVDKVHHQSLQVTLIEAAPRILPALPEALALKAQKTLSDLGVSIATQKTVSAIEAQTLVTPEGEIKADLLVWAAGIKAPAFLSTLGLPTNRINQLEIDFSLRVKGQSDIFAIGDCAFLVGENTDERPVPPTAQAAHQMAATCAKNIIATINHQPNQDFKYCDHGALVSLSRFQTLGNLLDQLFNKNWMVEGKLAHWAYASLYRQHQLALHGYWKTLWILLGSVIAKRIKPKLKLY
ncbi:MAG: NAD(P)/FAD-dependent oxidoreductase [Thiotrichales bacterium]|nr:NAD(P)/FAD-dependent oxidoreductase [Thiotrichales bacterium]